MIIYVLYRGGYNHYVCNMHLIIYLSWQKKKSFWIKVLHFFYFLYCKTVSK